MKKINILKNEGYLLKGKEGNWFQGRKVENKNYIKVQ